MCKTMRLTTCLILAFTLINVASSTVDAQTIRSANGKRMIRIKIFFTNPRSPEYATTCAAGEFVSRTIFATNEVANASLRLVFTGPTKEEKAKGMGAPTALRSYYRGVSIKKGVAVVNFRPGAQKYLYVNGPSCMTEEALAPISNTLLQFQTIKAVKYAINGQIIQDWDA